MCKILTFECIPIECAHYPKHVTTTKVYLACEDFNPNINPYPSTEPTTTAETSLPTNTTTAPLSSPSSFSSFEPITLSELEASASPSLFPSAEEDEGGDNDDEFEYEHPEADDSSSMFTSFSALKDILEEATASTNTDHCPDEYCTPIGIFGASRVRGSCLVCVGQVISDHGGVLDDWIAMLTE
ncbi:hypothetical protein BDW59DRAFT_164003 [Aspergillus cavernicola]|uniref:Uncharacterized protein n=1 Tax=Aspergillus cavernicola TaxID=176166 RepID=A0ABR4I248_9EURO